MVKQIQPFKHPTHEPTEREHMKYFNEFFMHPLKVFKNQCPMLNKKYHQIQQKITKRGGIRSLPIMFDILSDPDFSKIMMRQSYTPNFEVPLYIRHGDQAPQNKCSERYKTFLKFVRESQTRFKGNSWKKQHKMTLQTEGNLQTTVEERAAQIRQDKARTGVIPLGVVNYEEDHQLYLNEFFDQEAISNRLKQAQRLIDNDANN